MEDAPRLILPEPCTEWLRMVLVGSTTPQPLITSKEVPMEALEWVQGVIPTVVANLMAPNCSRFDQSSGDGLVKVTGYWVGGVLRIDIKGLK